MTATRQRGGNKRNKKIVAVENDEIAENIKKIDKKPSTLDIIFIIDSLKTNYVFYDLSDKEL